MRAPDLVGQNFGNFRVTARVAGKTHSRWSCTCTVCGTVKEAYGQQLRVGTVRCKVCADKVRAEKAAEKQKAQAARAAEREAARIEKAAKRAAREEQRRARKAEERRKAKKAEEQRKRRAAANAALRVRKELDAAQRRQVEKLKLARMDMFTIREQIDLLKEERRCDPFLSANDHELIDGHIQRLRGELQQARERVRKLKAA